MGRVSALIGQRTFKFWALSALVVSMAVLAGGIAYGTTASCNNTQTLNNSAFEVDTNANLVVNNHRVRRLAHGRSRDPDAHGCNGEARHR
jgi:hypothetical protein